MPHEHLVRVRISVSLPYMKNPKLIRRWRGDKPSLKLLLANVFRSLLELLTLGRYTTDVYMEILLDE